MADRNSVGCENINKYVCLKCNVFACNRSLKCSVPVSKINPGCKECTKFALCFKCDKEEHTIITKKDSSEKKENEEVVGTSCDAELVIQSASTGFHEYQKI